MARQKEEIVCKEKSLQRLLLIMFNVEQENLPPTQREE